MLRLSFTGGSLELRGASPEESWLPSSFAWDGRVGCFRAPASSYAALILTCRNLKRPIEDEARDYKELPLAQRFRKEARDYQQRALDAWRKASGQGVVVLPTGAGKTHVAMMAAENKQRSTLVVTPTLELMRQWYDTLRSTFNLPVGLLGGGSHDVQPLSVTTYDSAYLHMDHIGNRFGLVVFDECHHLPSGAYAEAAMMCLAPYRLGLTATPERSDGRDSEYASLIGHTVYARDIGDLAGDYLSNYHTERVVVELSPAERAEYEEERQLYRSFAAGSGIRLGSPGGWNQFIAHASRSTTGKRAMRAFRRHREIAFAAPAKLDYVGHLLHRHRSDRTLLFTQDNATAYAVSRRYLIPVITHHSKVKERSDILALFAEGDYRAIVTSKVLNEGVDVPSANVAVVISGSGSVREHVQRLGRVLRKQKDKQAVLYELVSAGTTETFTSARRREHNAYR